MTRRADSAEAAVLVHLASDPLVDPEQEWQWLAGLEESLAEAVASASAGELEGVYLVGEQWVLRARGPRADRLWAAMSNVLTRWSLPVDSYELRGGPPVPSTWRPLSEQGVLAALAMSCAA